LADTFRARLALGDNVVRRNRAEFALIGVLAVLAFLVRWAGRHEFTPDMRIFYVWYGKLDAAGGFAGLKLEIGNYNAPFLYLLAVLTYLPGSVILKIKAVWFVFDALLIFFTYKIATVRWPGWKVPALAAMAMAFLPTVVINSSFYGQCDAIWGAFALGGVWQFLKGRDWWGVALFTVALAFKPQAIFIYPLVLLLLLGGKARWRSLLIAPVVYVLLDVPAFIAGRGVWELLTLYNPSRQSTIVSQLTASAPSLWAFVPVTTRLESLRSLGYVFTAIVCIGVIYPLIAARAELHAKRIVTAAAFFSLVVPFILPGMHERYFYLADVMTLVLAFFRPRLWYAAILVELASLLSYLPFLFIKTQHGPMVPLMVMATMNFAALLAIGYALVGDLRVSPPAVASQAAPEQPEPEPEPKSETVVSRPAESRELLPAHTA
jgi:Gpi18-like mannosyltransferase